MTQLVRRAGLVCALLATAMMSPASLEAQSAPEEPFVLPSGQRFHDTKNEVQDRSSIAVPGSDIELHVWREVLESGQSQAFYAVSQGGALQGRVRATTYEVRLRDFRFDPLTVESPLVSLDLSARASNRLHLVQFHATPLPEFRAAIDALGGTVLRFLTDHSYIVDIAPTSLTELGFLPYVRWIGAYHPAFRLEAPLRDAIEGRVARLERQRYSIMLGQRSAVAQAGLADQIRSQGGHVELIESGGVRLEATLTQEQLVEVAHDSRVLFIDRWGGPAETDMDVVREVGGSIYLESLTGFNGQGVRGEVFDTELRTTHQEWTNAPIVHSASASCSVLHGTSSYSNNFAAGTSAPAEGMLPNGQGIFFCSSEATQFGGSTSRYDANEELIDPAGTYRAVFQTSSVGNARNLTYSTISAEVDDYLFLHQLLSTQSQSNSGTQQSRPQAWAKNIVSVGGFLHGGTADRCDDNWSFTASIGPAADGRIKPDLAFFYDGIFSASGSNDTSYTSFGGTSSATPQTSGHFGLLFQMWHEGIWAGHGGGADVFDSRPGMATAKALMINNAFRYDWTNPGGCSFGDIDRNKQGWGTADVRNLYDRAEKTVVIDQTDVITAMETKSYSADVADGETQLAVTMVYTDPMGTVGAGQARVNDLSLRVTSPSAVVYWGNNGLDTSNFSTAGGTSNTIDTVENVFIADPEAGIWTIDVIGDEIVEDGHLATAGIDAVFGLVINGDRGSQLFSNGFESGDTSAWSTTIP